MYNLPAIFLRLLFAVLLFSSVVLAARDRQPSKYIFYWGDLQIELTEGNAYHGSAEVSPDKFRRALSGAPHLWNGTRMVDTIVFQLEDRPVTAVKGSLVYLQQYVWLDSLFGQGAAGSQVFHLTGLKLDNGRAGAIDFRITGGQDQKASTGTGQDRLKTPVPVGGLRLPTWQERLWTPPPNTTALITHCSWGPYINSDIQRDHLTVAEFWESIRQEPQVDWTSPADRSRPIQVLLKLQWGPGQLTEEFRGNVGTGEYGRMLELLEIYRHRIKPGMDVQIMVRSADRYDDLFTATLTLLAENDPRQKLHFDQDGHMLKLKWGSFDTELSPLFLRAFQLPGGRLVHADRPRMLSVVVEPEEARAMLLSRPRFWVDNRRLANVSYSLVLSDSVRVDVPADGDLPLEELRTKMGADLDIATHFSIHALQADSFDLEPLSFRIQWRTTPQFAVPNQWNALLDAKTDPRLLLLPPTLDTAATYLLLKFDLPESTAFLVSVFTAEGENIYVEDGKFQAGRSTLKIPRNYFPEKGLYYFFLLTPGGIAKATFELD